MGLNCLQATKVAASRVKTCFRGVPVHNVLVLEPQLEPLLKLACTASSWTRGLHIVLIYVPLLGIWAAMTSYALRKKLYENKNVGPSDSLTNQFKHVFWVLKRTFSMRQFFAVPTTMFQLDVTNLLFSFVLAIMINPFLHWGSWKWIN